VHSGRARCEDKKDGTNGIAAERGKRYPFAVGMGLGGLLGVARMFPDSDGESEATRDQAVFAYRPRGRAPC
jgi:hypothetical protein